MLINKLSNLKNANIEITTVMEDYILAGQDENQIIQVYSFLKKYDHEKDDELLTKMLVSNDTTIIPAFELVSRLSPEEYTIARKLLLESGIKENLIAAAQFIMKIHRQGIPVETCELRFSLTLRNMDENEVKEISDAYSILKNAGVEKHRKIFIMTFFYKLNEGSVDRAKAIVQLLETLKTEKIGQEDHIINEIRTFRDTSIEEATRAIVKLKEAKLEKDPAIHHKIFNSKQPTQNASLLVSALNKLSQANLENENELREEILMAPFECIEALINQFINSKREVSNLSSKLGLNYSSLFGNNVTVEERKNPMLYNSYDIIINSHAK